MLFPNYRVYNFNTPISIQSTEEGAIMYKRTDETDAIIALVADYFNAMIDGNEEELRRIFHPKASIVGNESNELVFMSLDEFIAITPEAKTGDQPFDYQIDGVAMVGDTAVVTVSNYCFGTWFTDYLSMVICKGKWRIVAKTFFDHQATS